MATKAFFASCSNKFRNNGQLRSAIEQKQKRTRYVLFRFLISVGQQS